MGPSKRKAGSRRKSLQYAVSRVHINRGGYDTHGRYWGVGAPLYLVESRDFGAYTYVRAPDAKAALSKGEPEIERKIAQERRWNADTGG
jgi:hypothetical protein